MRCENAEGWEKPEKRSLCCFNNLQVPLVSGQLYHRQNNPPSKKIDSKSGSNGKHVHAAPLSHRSQEKTQLCITAICWTITSMQSCRDVGWKTPQCYLPEILFPRERPGCFLKSLVRGTTQGAYKQFLTASLRGKKKGEKENLLKCFLNL